MSSQLTAQLINARQQEIAFRARHAHHRHAVVVTGADSPRARDHLMLRRPLARLAGRIRRPAAEPAAGAQA